MTRSVVLQRTASYLVLIIASMGCAPEHLEIEGPHPFPAGAIATVSVQAELVVYPPQPTAESVPLATVRRYENKGVCGRVAFDAAGRLYALCWQGVAWGSPGQIEVYKDGAHAPAPPLRTIAGSLTRLDAAVTDIAVDAEGSVYVVRNNAAESSVLVFAPGDSGNVAPKREIIGSHTELDFAACIAVDAHKQIYVGNAGGGPVLVFAASANGDATPIRKIGGQNPSIGDMIGLAMDGAGRVYVADWVGQVLVFPAKADENTAPERVLTGARTRLGHPMGIAADSQRRIYVTTENDDSTQSLAIFAAKATGNVAPDVVLDHLWDGNVAVHP